MAKYTFKTDLSVSGIEKLQKELRNYQNKILPRKTNEFLEALGEIGIRVAKDEAYGDSHKFYQMVAFEKKVDNMTLVLIGRNDNVSGLHTEWYDSDGNYHDETISPIFALEWGTAAEAIGGYQGSFAVTGNHVNDSFWYYYEGIDENGNPINPHFATAEEANEPMYNAFLEMKKEIISTARKVFSHK